MPLSNHIQLAAILVPFSVFVIISEARITELFSCDPVSSQNNERNTDQRNDV